MENPTKIGRLCDVVGKRASLLYTSPRGRRLLPPLPRIVRQFRFPPKHAFRERFGGEGRGEGAEPCTSAAPSPQPSPPQVVAINGVSLWPSIWRNNLRGRGGFCRTDLCKTTRARAHG